MLLTPDGSPSRGKKDYLQKPTPDLRQRRSAPELEVGGVPPVINQHKHKKGDKKDKGFMTLGNRAKLRKALMKMNLLPRTVNK